MGPTEYTFELRELPLTDAEAELKSGRVLTTITSSGVTVARTIRADRERLRESRRYSFTLLTMAAAEPGADRPRRVTDRGMASGAAVAAILDQLWRELDPPLPLLPPVQMMPEPAPGAPQRTARHCPRMTGPRILWDRLRRRWA